MIDGNLEHVAHALMKTILQTNIKFATAVDMSKYNYQ